MWELIKAGDWPVIPLVLCSILVLGIVLERAWSLQRRRVLPAGLLEQVQRWCAAGEVDAARIGALRRHSALGRVLAAVLMHGGEDRRRQRENVEDTGRHVMLELERYLNMLGTLATVSPLIGLFGTVIGMIETFSAISLTGLGAPEKLAGGIAIALVNTAFGLFVAIPAYIFHRYYRGLVEELVADLERQASELVEFLSHQTARLNRERQVRRA
ncbi:MAG TPA: biopolymer transporter ExbB [Gammaproteobacteria bacterium]|uniref:MotA/TolQ/ExbB proton channel family protein n=1 Tax=Immundisolibacter sp. TaxID=1934948 RepID=UPI000E87E825|nr:biopolymer transporter ExbB [Gammaproteobacteria bacterium]HCZ47518.1 biopolymer transporter ExbB [Gammaproteobacteria bacterium]MCH76956.1 biopolymer transporter ExbB [Gammaproteobacteria bacterium]